MLSWYALAESLVRRLLRLHPLDKPRPAKFVRSAAAAASADAEAGRGGAAAAEGGIDVVHFATSPTEGE